MKKAIQIVLFLVIVVLGYILVDSILTPLEFQNTTKLREAAVIERIKDIRTAQRAYKTVHQRFTGSFDTLINFVLNDSLVSKKPSVRLTTLWPLPKGWLNGKNSTLPLSIPSSANAN